MWDIDEFRSLINQNNKRLYSPQGFFKNEVNFDMLHQKISHHIKFKDMLACIIYGSYLIKKKPNDIDVIVIMNNDKEFNRKVLITKDKIKKRDIVVGWEEESWNGSTLFPAGPVYRTISNKDWNPIAIDMNIKSLDVVREELYRNKNGDIADTCCYNAITKGCAIAKHKNYDSRQLFNGLENENKFFIKKYIFKDNYKICKY
jgi:hypothetical protein